MNVQVLPEQPAVEPLGVAVQQLVPQRVFVQLMSQPVAVHTALPLAAGGLHLVPHIRQFDVSVARLTQLVPQRVLVPQSTTQDPFSQSWLAEHEVVQLPQYCLEVLRSTAPTQAPQALLLQVCVPVLQLPQLRVAVPKHATHWPVLGKHSGVVPVQLVWFVHAPLVEHRRGVAPTQPREPGSHTAHLPLTQNPVAQSAFLPQASPTPQLPQLMPGPEHEFRLTNAPASLHW